MTDQSPTAARVAWYCRWLRWGRLDLEWGVRLWFRRSDCSFPPRRGDSVTVRAHGFGPLGLPRAFGIDRKWDEPVNLAGSDTVRLPYPHRVRTIMLDGCERLRELPNGMTLRSLSLAGCVSLQRLPHALSVHRLDLTGCSSLASLPPDLVVADELRLAACTGLSSLQPWVGPVLSLDLSHCTGLRGLPSALVVRRRLEIGGLDLRFLPPGCRTAQLYWHGHPVDERVAFHPETLSAEEIVADNDLGQREVKLQRFGVARFLAMANCMVVDADEDPGGDRELLAVPFRHGDWVVALRVRCPSTGQQHVLRVPPHLDRCRDAAAWVAGFSSPFDFEFVNET